MRGFHPSILAAIAAAALALVPVQRPHRRGGAHQDRRVEFELNDVSGGSGKAISG